MFVVFGENGSARSARRDQPGEDGAAIRSVMDAAWVWLDDREPGNAEMLAGFAGARGAREVFVSVPWRGPDQRVVETVAAMRRAGLRVSALGGSGEWAKQPQLAREWSVRATAGGLFDDMHLDIEPWTLPNWPASGAALLAGLAQATALVRATTGLSVDVDLAPHLAHTHPAGFAEVVASADAVTLMSYRDTVQDVLAVSTQARRSLTRLGRRYRLAVDTLPSGDLGTSFAGRSRCEMELVVAGIGELLRGERDFAGVVVHDLLGWRSLPP